MTTECSICFEQYQSEGDKCPKLLPCTHTLCSQCLRQVSNGRTRFECPECRDTLYVPEGNVMNFKTNRYILEHFEYKKKMANLRDSLRLKDELGLNVINPKDQRTQDEKPGRSCSFCNTRDSHGLQSLQCKHTFCAECLSQATRNETGITQCPMCRTHFQRTTRTPSHIPSRTRIRTPMPVHLALPYKIYRLINCLFTLSLLLFLAMEFFYALLYAIAVVFPFIDDKLQVLVSVTKYIMDIMAAPYLLAYVIKYILTASFTFSNVIKYGLYVITAPFRLTGFMLQKFLPEVIATAIFFSLLLYFSIMIFNYQMLNLAQLQDAQVTT